MPLPDPPVEIEFRDGVRAVPAHLASNIAVSEVDPVTVTFEEAVKLADNAALRNYLNNVMRSTIHGHFVENR
jgi:hypothetical protein